MDRNAVRLLVGILLMGGVSASNSAGERNWPQFRGPNATGVSESARLPVEWSATQNVAWKQPLPGRGWSSPICWGDLIFVTAVENTGTLEPAKKGLYFGGDRHLAPQTNHRWQVICLHRETGAIRWTKTVHEGIPRTAVHIKNSYASETPVTDGKHLFALFGNHGVYCLDFQGNLIWSKDLPARKMRLDWGTAASPVIHQETLFLVHDNEEQSEVIALNTSDGQERWRKSRSEKSNWSTPFIWKNPLRVEVITAGSRRTRSYDLTGNLLWELEGGSANTCGTPYQVGDLLLVSSGYILDSKRPMWGIKPGGQGNISLTGDATHNSSIVWSQKIGAPYVPSTIVYRDLLYVLYDQGMFACYEAQSGKPVYGKQRIPEGKAFTASPWAGAGFIFCLNEDGITTVIEAGKKFRVHRSNPLHDGAMCMATPAISEDLLLIRTDTLLYAIRTP